MKIFHCDHCRHLLFFENVCCLSCGHAVAYLPDLGVIGSLEPAGERSAGAGLWQSPIPRAAGRTYKLCENYSNHGVCNWALPADDPHSLCISCRLTRVIPDLSRPAHKPALFVLYWRGRRKEMRRAPRRGPLLSWGTRI